MCGFFQVIQKDVPIDADRFDRSLDSMLHRGPDARGIVFKERSLDGRRFYLGFGHRRLAILDLEDRADQPFEYDRILLLYNGEIYNFKQLRSDCRIRGASFTTTSDTEVLAALLTQNGCRKLRECNGMWALSFWNTAQNEIWLSRDRYGKKPLFYYLDDRVFCVSSTIRAIADYLELPLRYHQESLVSFLLSGFLFPSGDNRTHFQRINQVIPGHHACFDLNNWELRQERYHDPLVLLSLAAQDFSAELLAERLQQSVERRLISDRPVGLLLSGGIDSSLILSILNQCGHRDKVHIFMGDTGRSEDYGFASRCIDSLGLQAETIVTDYGTGAFEDFLQICLHHEKPFPFNGNGIAMSGLYKEVAARGVPVVLDGSGGDEIFGGYPERYLPFALRQAETGTDHKWHQEILRHYAGNKTIKRYRRPRHRPPSLSTTWSPFLKLPVVARGNISGGDPLESDELDFDQALCRDISPGGRLGDWLWHNDRNSMMHSVENRSPFLDCELMPFIVSGYRNKFRDGWNKYELRRAFDRFTPLPTQWRREKQGFRWDGKHFFFNNKDAIVEIIRHSDILREYARKDLFCSLGDRFPQLFRSSLSKRLLGIAGIEYMLDR